MRYLSYLLRHTRSCEMTEDGWVQLSHLADFMQKPIVVLRGAIIDDPKNRFELDGNRVRARYGHSNKIHIEYPIASHECQWFHATSYKAWEQIKEEGFLRKMNRDAVHFANDIRYLRPRPVILRLHYDTSIDLRQASTTVAICKHDIPITNIVYIEKKSI